MLVAEATWLAFAVFSGLRTISYVPQIVRIAKDPNGASAISYPTWLLWTGAHASASLYAAMNLNEVWLAISVDIAGIHPHSSSGNSVRAESELCIEGEVLKCPVFLVHQ